jgi:hypothetical protein
VVDDRHGVAQLLGLVELVSAEDQCLAPVPQLEEGGLEEGDVDRVKADERFVHQQDVRIVEHGGDELDFLLITLGEAFGLSMGVLHDPKPGQPVEGDVPRFTAAHAIQGAVEDELVEDRHAHVQAPFLGHVAPRSARPLRRVTAIPGRFASIGPQEAEDDPHRCRLTSAVGSEKAEDAGRPDREGHAVEGLDSAESLHQAFDDQCHFLRLCLPASTVAVDSRVSPGQALSSRGGGWRG